jgi:hypothetical protein
MELGIPTSTDEVVNLNKASRDAVFRCKIGRNQMQGRLTTNKAAAIASAEFLYSPSFAQSGTVRVGVH